jgi:recombinational DNA repair protein (RecF pathway)
MSYTVYDTPAVVVDGWPYKDASRRLVMQTKDLGRILVRAQAVRKLSSKLRPATQLYAQSRIEVVYGKSGWRLVGALPKQNVYFSAGDAGQKAIRRTTGLLTRLVPAQQPDRKLFAIVTSGMQALAMVDAPEVVGVTETLFVFRLVSSLGYAPDQSAHNLKRYLQSQSYTHKQLENFSNKQEQAVAQINQALANAQM